MEPTLKLALQTLGQNKQAIIFTPSRISAEKTAEDISKLTVFSLPELENEILKAASTPTRQCRKLSLTIKKGIAFHHAGLLQKQKELIEDEFRTGKIKIICATPTLAAGLSLPVFRVIIKSLKRYSGQWGMDWIPVLEYLQMAGRAGRPEYEAFGEAICIAKDNAEKEEIYERYICGKPEAIYSKLAVEPVLRTYLLSLVSSGIIQDKNSMGEFFHKTFWAYQFKDLQKLETILQKMLRLLEGWGFIVITKSPKNDFVSANELEASLKEEKLYATLIGKRISELYLDPLTAQHLLECLAKFNQTKNTFSLLQMISHTLEMRPLLNIKSREQDFIQEELTARYNLLLEEEPGIDGVDYDDFISSIKTALFFESWIEEHDEDFLLEKFDIRPGEIRIKQETADWLLYAAEELAALQESKKFDTAVEHTSGMLASLGRISDPAFSNPSEITDSPPLNIRSLCSGVCRGKPLVEKTDYKPAVREIRKLRLRVRYGVKEELLALIKLRGIGGIRARKLHAHGIKDLGDVKKADITTLSQLLGKAVAESIQKQLGEEIREIPKGTRKGQTSILKYTKNP